MTHHPTMTGSTNEDRAFNTEGFVGILHSHAMDFTGATLTEWEIEGITGKTSRQALWK